MCVVSEVVRLVGCGFLNALLLILGESNDCEGRLLVIMLFLLSDIAGIVAVFIVVFFIEWKATKFF